jgi:aquaporin Z
LHRVEQREATGFHHHAVRALRKFDQAFARRIDQQRQQCARHRRRHAGQVIPYNAAQLVGAIVAALLLYAIAKGAPGFDLGKGFATNGYAEHSPGHYDLLSALLTEVVMTMLFLFVIMGSTHGKAPAGFAPLAIGLCLTLIHLVSIPVTNTSVNPARSTGPALIVGGAALTQLWLFWIAPLVGGVLGGVIHRWLSGEPQGQARPRPFFVMPGLTRQPMAG